jgi:hypothetical protein
MKPLVLRSLVVAIFVACVSNLCIDLYSTSSSRCSIIPQARLDEIHAMPYKQAVEEMGKHYEPISSLPYIWSRYRTLTFWQYKSGPVVFIFLSAFAGCLWVGNWTLKRTGR